MTTLRNDEVVGALDRGSWLRTLGWAAYLACSWTWCIGMFLPVLLVRDYGVWGFVVFAVPNVVGAGAMGWVLRQGASERIIQHHGASLRAFSIITLLFQLLFFLLVLGLLSPRTDWNVVVWPLVIALGFVFWSRSVTVAAIVWGVSVALLVLAWRSGGDTVFIREGLHSSLGVVYLAPVCAFGFVLCPYLDLTFHRARQSLARVEARAAFAIGFGFLFLVMILGTLSYAPLAMGLMDGEPGSDGRGAIFLAGAHILLQLTFTCAVHLRELYRNRGPRLLRELLAVGGVVLLLCIIVADGYEPQRHGAIDTREVIYRVFMSFYGLLFPAYVWLCMIPTRDGHSGIEGSAGRKKLAVLAGVVVLAAPCYWIGFIELDEIWLAPGLGIVLLGRLLVRKRTEKVGGGEVVRS